MYYYIRASPADYLNRLHILYLGSGGHKMHSNRPHIRLSIFVGPTNFLSHYPHLLGRQTWLPIFLSPTRLSLSLRARTQAPRPHSSPIPSHHCTATIPRSSEARSGAYSPARRPCSWPLPSAAMLLPANGFPLVAALPSRRGGPPAAPLPSASFAQPSGGFPLLPGGSPPLPQRR
jgi:hypothetical protein